MTANEDCKNGVVSFKQETLKFFEQFLFLEKRRKVIKKIIYMNQLNMRIIKIMSRRRGPLEIV